MQFYVDSQMRQDLCSLEESECREILERYVRQHQIPVDNRNSDGSTVLSSFFFSFNRVSYSGIDVSFFVKDHGFND